jgi:hypothetical protein
MLGRFSKTTHEGTSKVKSSKFQLLTTKFENMRMMEDENIQDYHLNILDIANSFDSLGEKISDENLEVTNNLGEKISDENLGYCQSRMMTTGTNVLQEILEVTNKEKPKSTGFNYKALNRKQRNRDSAYTLEDCGIVSKQ